MIAPKRWPPFRGSITEDATRSHCYLVEGGLKEGNPLLRWRREWDSNPRKVAPHTLSRRADSSALASLPSKAARSQLAPGDPAAPKRFR
jgi:hypothetical protein